MCVSWVWSVFFTPVLSSLSWCSECHSNVTQMSHSLIVDSAENYTDCLSLSLTDFNLYSHMISARFWDGWGKMICICNFSPVLLWMITNNNIMKLSRQLCHMSELYINKLLLLILYGYFSKALISVLIWMCSVCAGNIWYVSMRCDVTFTLSDL